MADKLVFKLGGKSFGIETAAVAGIVEVNKVFFLPGGSGIVKGIISLRGNPVTVIDCGVLGAEADKTEGAETPRKIIVVRESERILGIDIGSAEVSFLWRARPGEKNASSTGEVDEKNIKDVNCAELFNRAEKVLSPEHKRVVVADDMEFFRTALRRILSSAGFRVIAEAHNGEEAVEMAEVLKPDIVILDVVMPVKNGLDAAVEINRLDPRPGIVMCSSLDDRPVVEGALRAGADAYITKPLDRTRVIETLYGLKPKKS
ncbi:MAG: hypothetical protein BMS9Abin23_0047 [Thermodesulfobacteriota bacterium]|nr:MAG: hypothetical protein BMS9Abin23_0047 [Thermodesulfobacteriota bacterium]